MKLVCHFAGNRQLEHLPLQVQLKDDPDPRHSKASFALVIGDVDAQRPHAVEQQGQGAVSPGVCARQQNQRVIHVGLNDALALCQEALQEAREHRRQPGHEKWGCLEAKEQRRVQDELA